MAKKPKNKLPKKVKPTDVTVPGAFGARTIRGVTGAIRQATRKKKKR